MHDNSHTYRLINRLNRLAAALSKSHSICSVMLQTLPSELVSEIASHLSYNDIYTLRQVTYTDPLVLC
jgi:hypothetical protein